MDFDPGPSVFNLTATGARDLYVLKLDGNGNFVWARNFNPDAGNSIAYDPSGFVYVTTSSSPTSQCSVIKLDTDGNSIWTRTITGGQTGGVSVSVDPTGNVIATGWLTGTADFDPSAATLNLIAPATETGLFIWKLNGTGDLVWANQLPRGNVSSLLLFGSGSSLDAMGNIYLSSSFRGTQDFDLGAGTFTLTAAGTDVFVCKLDNSGNFVWAQSINVSVCNFLSTDGAGNSYITGSFTGTADFDPSVGVFNQTSAGNDETYILKLNSSGNFAWATRTGSPSDDEGTAIHADASGNVYLTSYFYQSADFDPTCGSQTLTSGGNSDAYIQKLSSALAPTITSFSPTTGSSGTTVTITGVGFSTTSSNNTVRFFNNRTATVTASTTTSITAIVPASTITGIISVTTNCLTAASATNFTISTLPPPTITSFTPSSGPVGTTVTITGTNFDPTPANNIVAFNGVTAVVTASTTTSITTTVPTGATTGTITVTIAGNTATSTTNFTVTPSLPTITSFTPTSGPVGTTVTITGTNF
ncbi:MAG: IPT/TIG domain-containing protein, partial [Cyclobacteriaceae bacterium]|nr:IPT/TIG domain-containing protein [Cyclobacteriaceae bacterium]